MYLLINLLLDFFGDFFFDYCLLIQIGIKHQKAFFLWCLGLLALLTFTLVVKMLLTMILGVILGRVVMLLFHNDSISNKTFSES